MFAHLSRFQVYDDLSLWPNRSERVCNSQDSPSVPVPASDLQTRRQTLFQQLSMRIIRLLLQGGGA